MDINEIRETSRLLEIASQKLARTAGLRISRLSAAYGGYEVLKPAELVKLQEALVVIVRKRAADLLAIADRLGVTRAT